MTKTSEWDMGPTSTNNPAPPRSGRRPGALPRLFTTVPNAWPTIGRKAEESLAGVRLGTVGRGRGPEARHRLRGPNAPGLSFALIRAWAGRAGIMPPALPL